MNPVLNSVLNYGSINIDHVYRVPQLVQPGETIASTDYRRGSGGKGYNQSIALARAGVRVAHAGKVGEDGAFLVDALRAEGVDTAYVDVGDEPTGHAIIQVDTHGENAIVLHRGANHAITAAEARTRIDACEPGSWLLLQNEISCLGEILQAGLSRGLRVALNPAPMTDAIAELPLDALSLLIVNAPEGAALSGEQQSNAIVDTLHRRLPRTPLVVTLGSAGAYYVDATQRIFEPARVVDAVDTTAAGDTFVGYLLASLVAGSDPAEALTMATRAAALSVTRRGAAEAIPVREEL